MKNSAFGFLPPSNLLKGVLLTLCSFFLIELVNAQNDSIAVVGIVKGDDVNLKGSTLKVYYKNHLAIERNLTNHKALVNLPLNEYCTLEFSKEGFIDKRIVFDTKTELINIEVDKYEFEIHLLAEEWILDELESDLDFPIAILRIDPEKGRLRPDDAYSEYLWNLQRNAIEASADETVQYSTLKN
ncbi:MAG: hypothetical protein RIC15_00430 [Vicingaceae bacterium]